MIRPKRSQAIVDAYLRSIVAGELRTGDPLPTEATLAERFDVSRTAVREAVQALAGKGFVEVRQGIGTTVAPVDQWHVLDADYLHVAGFDRATGAHLVEARALVEPAIAALAAGRASDEQLHELRQRTGEGGAFHHVLARATGNPVVMALYASIAHLGVLAADEGDLDEGPRERSRFWHEHIADAVAGHDPEAAEDAMRMHLRQLRADLEARVP